MGRVNLNFKSIDKEVVDAEFRPVYDTRKLHAASKQAKQDSFSREFTFNTVEAVQLSYDQQRAQKAYGSDKLKDRLELTRRALKDSRSTFNANESLPHPWGLNQLALA